MGAHGQHHVGEHHTGHEVHLVALDQAVGGLFGGVGAGLVVGHDHFGGQGTELAARVFDCQVEAVPNVNAKRRTRTGQGAEHADLDLVGSPCRASQKRKCSHSQGQMRSF